MVQRRRGLHSEFVFTYQPVAKEGMPTKTHRRVETQNNPAFQNARPDVGLIQVRVYDLRHTYGQRLRDAGVSEEDHALLLGHARYGMPQRRAAATVAKLFKTSNAVLKTRDRTTVLRASGSSGSSATLTGNANALT